MFTKAVLPDTFRALQLVSHIPIVQKAYLAGGTSLALQLGHRISVDLDFFTQEVFEANSLSTDLKQYPEFIQKGQAWRTVWGNVGKTSFSLFFYEYPLLESTIEFEGIHLAGKSDIAAMKIHALEDRGTRRDFVDVYILAKSFSLDQMLRFFEKKYGHLDDHLYSIIRSLTYFEDAENEAQTPRMLVPVDWDQVKKFFRSEATRLAREQLGIQSA